MPILGIPTTGGTGRMFLALVASAAVWWLIGQLAAARVSRSPVVGIREWATAFLGTGIAIWVGSVAGLLLGAFALGAF